MIDNAVTAAREALDYERRPDHRRSWQLLSMMVAVIRGILADNLVTDPRGFRAINDEDYNAWLLRHGAHPDVLDFALVRGLYDLVFAYEDADPQRPSFGAGQAIFLTALALFQYKGAIFWKMTAGMGDIVVAPLYQALRQRGVEFEFFHRLDALHLDDQRLAIDSITMGRQVRLAEGLDAYEPLTKVRGLPVFPSVPLTEQLADGQIPGGGWHSLETHWADRNDAETRVLRRGVDFDHVVLAVSVGMLPIVAGEMIDDRVEWQEMTSRVRTVATQAFQIWLRPDEPTLGWHEPAVTISAYLRPFETWASMPQTLWSEDWPEHDRPGTVAYFCGTMNAPWPTGESGAGYLHRYQQQVRDQAADYIDRNLRPFFPNAVTESGFDWHLLSGVNGERGRAALDTQHVSVNVDPSDRYVQSVPGTERYRLAARRKRLRQPGFGRRLDGLRHERGLHRSGGDVGAHRGQRTTRPAPLPPHSGPLPALSRRSAPARSPRSADRHAGQSQPARHRLQLAGQRLGHPRRRTIRLDERTHHMQGVRGAIGFEVDPPHQLAVEQKRPHVVAVLPLVGRRVDLDAVVKPEQPLHPRTEKDQRVERAQQRRAAVAARNRLSRTQIRRRRPAVDLDRLQLAVGDQLGDRRLRLPGGQPEIVADVRLGGHPQRGGGPQHQLSDAPRLR